MHYLKSYGINTGEDEYPQQAFYSLILIYNLLYHRIGGYLKDWGLTPAQFNILMILNQDNAQQGISQVELSKQLIVTPSNTTRLIEKMEQERLIMRQAQSADKRIKLVVITPKGQTFVNQIWPGYDQKLKAVFASLKPEQTQLTAQVLTQWLNELVK